MKNIKFGAGFTVFVLFFGVALLEAIKYQHWLSVALWASGAIVFLIMDNMNQRKKSKSGN